MTRALGVVTGCMLILGTLAFGQPSCGTHTAAAANPNAGGPNDPAYSSLTLNGAPGVYSGSGCTTFPGGGQLCGDNLGGVTLNGATLAPDAPDAGQTIASLYVTGLATIDGGLSVPTTETVSFIDAGGIYVANNLAVDGGLLVGANGLTFTGSGNIAGAYNITAGNIVSAPYVTGSSYGSFGTVYTVALQAQNTSAGPGPIISNQTALVSGDIVQFDNNSAVKSHVDFNGVDYASTFTATGAASATNQNILEGQVTAAGTVAANLLENSAAMTSAAQPILAVRNGSTQAQEVLDILPGGGIFVDGGGAGYVSPLGGYDGGTFASTFVNPHHELGNFTFTTTLTGVANFTKAFANRPVCVCGVNSGTSILVTLCTSTVSAVSESCTATGAGACSWYCEGQ